MFTLTLIYFPTLAFGEDDKGYSVLPVLDSDYEADLGLAVFSGALLIPDVEQTSPTYGAELSFRCPLFSVPGIGVRQQISLMRSGGDISVFSLEISPHFMFVDVGKLSAGLGPSVGIARVDNDDEGNFTWSAGLGASLRFDLPASLYVGGEARYAFAGNAVFLDNERIDNVRFLGKIGYQF